MSKQSTVSRRLLAAAASALPVLVLSGVSQGADPVTASDIATVRPGTSNATANPTGTPLFFTKNSLNQNNNGSDAVGYMKFALPAATYPTGVRSAFLSIDSSDQYFTQATGPGGFNSYSPQFDFQIFGLPDVHPNENFIETTLRSNGWTGTIGSTHAVNVGLTTANNNPPTTANTNQYGEFADGFTPNPRPITRPGVYTAEPTWVAVPAGTGFVADANAGGPDNFTYDYINSTTANTAGKTPGPDGVPDASQENMAGTTANDLYVDVSEFLYQYNVNELATFAIKKVQEGNGGATFFVRTGPTRPSLVVEAGIPLFWDTDGTNPGSGGATPSGTWNATNTNFNSDSAGGAGTLYALSTPADPVVFGAGSDATGAYTVTLDGTRRAYQVNVEDGNVTLTGGTLATRAVDVAAGATATINSAVTGGPTGSFTKKGAGTLTLTAANTYTGGTKVEAGTLKVNRMHESNPVNITGGTLQVVESSPTLADGLPTGNNASVSRPSSLTVAAGATLDLANNDMVLDYTNVGDNPAVAIEALIAQGYNGGNWFGTGITSSVAQQDGNFALAVADNGLLNTAYTSFSGLSVDSTSVLVKFTWVDDLDLDGQVTTNDAITFGNNYSLGDPATRATGDMDYDGVFTTNDAIIFGNNYDTSLPSLPEPGTLGVFGLLGGLACRSRRIAVKR